MTPAKSLRLLLLLLALAAALFFYTNYQPPRSGLFVQNFAGLPEVVAPEGALLEAFRGARPATLQIEIGSSALALPAGPLGVGTGFFISPEGLVLTAYHVVDPGPGRNFPGEESVTAVSPDGRRYPLELVGFDAYHDLALLQAEDAEDVPYLPLASQPPAVGDEIVAIGNSRGDFLQGRAGAVRRLNVRAVQATFADGTVELSAALAPGDSGGPVVNEAGEAVGVVSYIAFAPSVSPLPEPRLPFLRAVPNDGYAAYAVPVAAEDATLSALRAGEQRDVPVIGFTLGGYGLREYNPRYDEARLGRFPGVVVGNVQPNGPADRAGLRDAVQRPVYNEDGEVVAVRTLADVIVSVDGERTPTYDDLVSVLRRRQVGQEVELMVQRGDELLRLRLELGGSRSVFGG